MPHKLCFKNLIFINLLLILLSCNEQQPKKVLPDPSDSLANTEAVKQLSKAMEESPDNAELYYQRGQLYANQKFLNRAEDDFIDAVKRDSLNPLYHYVLGRTQYAMNQTKDAANQYEKALALKPDYTEVLIKLADLYFVVKEHPKSLELLNRGIKMDPSNAYLYHMLGMNYKEMGDTGRAIYHFQTAIEYDPKDVESTLYIANLYAAQKKVVAMEYFNTAIKLRPKNPDVWFGKAVFEQNMRMYKDALKDYRRVIDLQPENYLAYYNVGYLNFENGMLDEAMRSWNICSQMNPSYAPVFYMKGLVQEEKKNKKDALINYRVAIELDPSNALYKQALERIQ